MDSKATTTGLDVLTFRAGEHSDLAEIGRIHKLAYSREHFTSLLPLRVLVGYYGFFCGGGTQILLAERCGAIVGFAVYGEQIPQKIAQFERKWRRALIASALSNPLIALHKIVIRAFRRSAVKTAKAVPDFLLLSIAVIEKGTGIGTQLLDRMIADARQARQCEVGLYVNADNTHAINTYFSNGFKIISINSGQYTMVYDINLPPCNRR